MDRKFTVLHIIVWIFRVLGALVLVVSLIAGIAGMFTGFGHGFGMMNRFGYGRMMGVGFGFGTLFGGLIAGILLYGIGEVIELLLAIEMNTRSHMHGMEEKKVVQPQVPPEVPVNPQ